MLVLSRRENEEIVIREPFGSEIRLVVLEVKGNKVRLGFEAAPHVRILRKEVSHAAELTAEAVCL
jgi:carbon storage regulator